MRLLFVGSILLASAMALTARAEQRELDSTGQYSYAIPDGWKAITRPKAFHDVLVLPAADGKNRNIIVTNQPGASDLEKLKAAYERDLAKAMKDFELIKSEIVELKDKRRAMRLVNINTTPGVAVRQVNYVVEVGKKRYFVACTVLKEDADTYDAAFEEFVNSMAEPPRPTAPPAKPISFPEPMR
jgi:hypothetical protein